MNWKAVLFGVILALFASRVQSAEKSLVAVSDLSAYGVDSNTVRIFTDRLRSEVTKSGHFQVIEREQMNDILTEQAFQQSGCVKEECVVEMGQMLGVDYLISGSVGNAAGTWSFSVKMINIATGQIENTVDEVTENSVSKVLTDNIPNIVIKLIKSRSGQTGGVQLSTGLKGDIFINSNPAGAKVWMDDILQEGLTPLTIQGAATGNRNLRLQKEDLHASIGVEVRPNEIKKIDVTLTQNVGQLKVLSQPPGAMVFIGGKRQNEPAPALYQGLPIGNSVVEVKMDGYLPFTSKVGLSANKVEEISVDLQRGAQLKLNSNQPFFEADLGKKGVHKLQGKESAWLMAPGSTSLTFSKQNFNTIDTTILLVAGEEFRLNLAFAESVESIKARKRSRLLTVRWGSFGTAVLAAGAGYFMQTKVDAAYSDYKASSTQQDFSNNWNKVESNKTMRNVAYGSAAALAAIGAVTFAF